MLYHRATQKPQSQAYSQHRRARKMIMEGNSKKTLLSADLNKDQQQTNWAQNDLSSKQLEYAANDVLELVQIYRKLTEMMDNRPPFSSGRTVNELNIKAQAMLPGMVDLLVNGYGDKNGGWESSLFTH